MARTITAAERHEIIEAVARSGYGEPVYPHERELTAQLFDAIVRMAHIDVEVGHDGANN